MTTTELLEHLRAEAMKLPDEERRQLVRSLQETLDDESDIHPGWRDELAKRAADVDNGTADLKSVSETIAEVRARLAR
jgi:hypothetical protein